MIYSITVQYNACLDELCTCIQTQTVGSKDDYQKVSDTINANTYVI